MKKKKGRKQTSAEKNLNSVKTKDQRQKTKTRENQFKEITQHTHVLPQCQTERQDQTRKGSDGEATAAVAAAKTSSACRRTPGGIGASFTNLEAPRSCDAIQGRGVLRWRKRQVNGAGVVQKAHDVAVSKRQNLRDFFEPPKPISRLEPEVGAEGEWKSAEAAAIAGEAGIVVPRGK